LTRADLARQLENTQAESRRRALRQAIEALDAELSALGD